MFHWFVTGSPSSLHGTLAIMLPMHILIAHVTVFEIRTSSSLKQQHFPDAGLGMLHSIASAM